MAEIKETVTIPARTEERVKAIRCELCGRESTRGNQWLDDPKVRGKSPNKAEVTVTFRVGDVWPEGDFTTTHVLDLCPSCFLDKLVPWFTAQGGTVRQEEGKW